MIFVLDLDGTIIDSSYRHGALLESLLCEKKIPYPPFLSRDFLEHKREGYSTKKYLQEVLKIDEPLSDTITKQWIGHIEDINWLETDILYDDSILFLESIYLENIIYYLSCRSSETALLEELERLRIDHYASDVFIPKPNDGASGKKKYLKLIESLHKDTIIMVGDTEIDYQAAKYADCNCYILNRGFRNKNYWDSCGIVSHTTLPKQGGVNDEDWFLWSNRK